MLKYYKDYKVRLGNPEEITYEEALRICLGSFRDNDMTRDMLTIPNRISCMYSIVGILEEDEDGHLIGCQPGLYNLLPMDVAYDDNGNRV